MIDTAHAGWKAVSGELAETGLKLEDGVLAVAYGDGITVDSTGVSVLAGAGLEHSDNGVRVKVASGGGLRAPTDGLSVVTGQGLVTTDSGITVDYGSGLEILGNKLTVKTGTGVTTAGGALSLESGLLGTTSLIDIVRRMSPSERQEVFLTLSRDARELEEKMTVVKRLVNQIGNTLDESHAFDDQGIIIIDSGAVSLLRALAPIFEQLLDQFEE
ncbi:MAG: hypothetical protein H0X39_05180 [Actinobacteria bacterium]|nr:hypothetical protein [Actinomycetota bacterium]